MDLGREDAIRLKAYEIWENEGRPDGRAEEHWVQASREIECHDELSETAADAIGTVGPEADLAEEFPARPRRRTQGQG